METKIISTNLMVEVPIGYELVITPRSGLATKGITIGNAPGCVDSDYRGVVGVILYNNGGTPFILTHGDRIAQCKLKKLEPTNWNHVNKLSETSRGTGGFGHTGIK
jgi:dUTP pyrophosphatase